MGCSLGAKLPDIIEKQMYNHIAQFTVYKVHGI